jgi:hypothetical protein
MAEAVQEQTKELERLEQAAEEASRPEEIRRNAARQHPSAVPKNSKIWFVSYLAVAAVFGAAIFLLDCKESLFSTPTREKIHRYLLGALGIVGLLTAAKGWKFM